MPLIWSECPNCDQRQPVEVNNPEDLLRTTTCSNCFTRYYIREELHDDWWIGVKTVVLISFIVFVLFLILFF